MTFEIWLAFVAASAVVLAIPGPTILLVIGQSLGAGRRGALPPLRAMRDAYAVTALNPKSIAFFVAFAPQFVVAGSAFAPQAAVLIATFVVMAAANAALYVLVAGRLAGAMRRPAARRLVNRAGGTLPIGAGLASATLRRI
jgi:threonine/homoserine/homoserine lactone efflux protein